MKRLLTVIAALLLGVAAAQAQGTSVLQFRPVAEAASAATKPFKLPERDGTSETVHLENKVLLDDNAIQSATVKQGEDGSTELEITFTEAGAKRFAEITKQQIGKQLAILVRGRLHAAPIIQEPFTGNSASLPGLDEREAKEIAAAFAKRKARR